MLAQAAFGSPTSLSVAGWLGSCMAVLGIVVLAGKAKDTIFGSKAKEQDIKLSPNPLNVAMVKDLATKDEVQHLENTCEKKFQHIEDQLQDERRTARVANGKVHARIDKVIESNAEIKGELKQVNTNLNLLLKHKLSQ